MTAALNDGSPTVEAGDLLAPLRDRAGAEEVFGPVLAGAYARGVADTLDLLGIPALLLDDGGRVLIANGAARRQLPGALKIRADRLQASNRKDDRQIADLIAAVLVGAPAPRSAVLAGCGVTVHACPAPGRGALPDQLMHVVVTIDGGACPAAALVARAGT